MAFIKISRRSFLNSNCFFKVKGVLFSAAVGSGVWGKILYKMKTVYIQNSAEEEKVQISISYNENNVSRMFQFERKISESLDDFLKKLEQKIRDFYAMSRIKKRLSKELVLGEESKINLYFMINNQRVPNEINFRDVFRDKIYEGLKLRIVESDYDVIINAPMIKSLTLPKILKVGSVAYPKKLVAQSTAEDMSEFVWFKSLTPKKPSSWVKCGEGFIYHIKEEDDQYFLKLLCTPKNFLKVGPSFEAESICPVGRFQNTAEMDKRHELTKEKTADDELRILTYNILAESYTQTKEAKASLFTHCDKDYLDYSYRKCLLSYELKGYNADILCLQEVYRSFFKNELLTWGSGLNYNSLYHEKDGSREGCAFLYNSSKFEVLDVNKHVFSSELSEKSVHSDIYKKLKESLKARLQNVASIFQVIVLKSLTVSNNVLIVGNTHMYFHPNASHVRLLQGIVTCTILTEAVEKWKKLEPEKQISVLLCGDFNCVPENAFHKLLQEGFLDENCSDWKSCENEEVENVTFSNLLKMKSAYDNSKYTNYTPLFKGCLDYIYFQDDYLSVKQTVPVPNEEVLNEHNGIPSQSFPSDHIALVVDFKFKDAQNLVQLCNNVVDLYLSETQYYFRKILKSSKKKKTAKLNFLK